MEAWSLQRQVRGHKKAMDEVTFHFLQENYCHSGHELWISLSLPPNVGDCKILSPNLITVYTLEPSAPMCFSPLLSHHHEAIQQMLIS